MYNVSYLCSFLPSFLPSSPSLPWRTYMNETMFVKCPSSCFQDQFEFALTAVAEEVNAILKALPQWNQYDPDRTAPTPAWLSHSDCYLTLPFLSMMMIIMMKKDAVPVGWFLEMVMSKNHLLYSQEGFMQIYLKSDFKYLWHWCDAFRYVQRVIWIKNIWNRKIKH